MNKRPNWPEFSRHGLSMRIVSDSSAANNGDCVEFTFEHSKDYQIIQFAFLDAVESLDHNNIIVNRLNFALQLKALSNRKQ